MYQSWSQQQLDELPQDCISDIVKTAAVACVEFKDDDTGPLRRTIIHKHSVFLQQALLLLCLRLATQRRRSGHQIAIMRYTYVSSQPRLERYVSRRSSAEGLSLQVLSAAHAQQRVNMDFGDSIHSNS
jgi:hypothetical protein